MEMKKRALVSVSDKTGIVGFCRRLSACGYEIVSTGGTARALQEAVEESPATHPKPRSGRKTGSGRGHKKGPPEGEPESAGDD